MEGGVVKTGVGKLLKEVCQVNKGVEPVLLRCLDDAVDHGAGASASGRVGEQPVLPPDDKRLDGAFRPIVVDLEPAVFQKCRQFLPLVEAVARRLAQGALGKGLGLLNQAWNSFKIGALRSCRAA